MQSIKSNALEPTRPELAGLSFGRRILRLTPVYGLPLLTLALIVLFSILLPDTFPTWLNARSILADKSIVALLALSAFGQSIAGPNISALISMNADPAHQGQYLGLNNAAGALARLAGPLFASIGFDRLSVDAPFYLAGLLVLPAIFLALKAS